MIHDGDNHAVPRAQSNLLNESCVGPRTHNHLNAWKSSYSTLASSLFNLCSTTIAEESLYGFDSRLAGVWQQKC